MDMQLSVIFSLIIGLSIAIFVIELIRRKKINLKRQSSKRNYRDRNYNFSPALDDSSTQPDYDDVKVITKEPEPNMIEQDTMPAIPKHERKPLPEYEDIVVINIMAEPDKKFVGYDLLQALLSAGMRFGKMNIFHRHEEANGKGDVLFSLASATKPGIFDIHKMGSVSCVGLSMFMRISEHDDPLYVYDLLVKTATLLAEDLDGNLLEANHQPLTREAIEYRRDWIHGYQFQGESESAYNN